MSVESVGSVRSVRSVGLFEESVWARVTIESTQFNIRTCRKHTCGGSFILLGCIAIRVRGYGTGGIGNTMETIETIEDN